MRKVLAFACSAVVLALTSGAQAANGGRDEIYIRAHTFLPTMSTKALATMVRVDLEYRIRSDGQHDICKGPYTVTITYAVKPVDENAFEKVGASVNDLYFVPNSIELLNALSLAGKPTNYSLGMPGDLEFKVNPPDGALLSSAEFAIYNKVDPGYAAGFSIPFCIRSE